MTFPVLGANSAVGGYAINNSLRFNDNDSPLLSYTPSSTATDRKKSTISFWFKIGNVTSTFRSLYRFNDGSGTGAIYLRSGNNLQFGWETQTTNLDLNLTAIQRDVSAWYHFFVNYDTTQATASDRVNIYINGVKQTAFGTETYPNLNDTVNHLTNGKTYYIGGDGQSSDKYFDGYIAEFHAIDGQAKAHTDFGEFDEDSGIWKPIQYTGTYGTNGFYLDFENSGSLGADQSGNGNDFTPTNLASTDQTTDTPTNNFATINALANYYNPATLSEGNLRVDFASGVDTVFNISTMGVSTGKWYCEIKAVTIPDYAKIGIASRPCIAGGNSDNLSAGQYNYGYSASNGNVDSNNTAGGDGGTYIGYGATWDDGDIIGIGLDLDNNRLYFSKNGTWQNSADPSAGTGGVVITDPTLTQDGVYYFGVGDNRNDYATRMDCNFGNAPYTISSGNSDGNGYGNFEYAPPSGYLALCTQNLATELSPTIDDGSQYFNTVLYTGNGGTDRSITGVGFQPDFVWIKERNNAVSHMIYNSTSGANKRLSSDNAGAEATDSDGLKSFDSDGWTMDAKGSINGSSDTYVAWNWLANGGTTSSNTDGSITSTVQANTTAGFSIVTYTGTGASGSVGHGLTKAPEMVICKQRTDAGTAWQTGHTGLTNWNYKLLLNDTTAESVNANVFPSAPTSSVINLGLAGDSNGSGKSQLIYAFHSVEGYSKFGSYTANGSTDGVFLYTGFKPAFLIVKITSTGGDWILIDNKRSDYNVTNEWLNPNSSSAEQTSSNNNCDFLSNGIKLRSNNGDFNYGSNTYIYMAFAENPFVTSSGVPVVAR
jgi:hypothetical protein